MSTIQRSHPTNRSLARRIVKAASSVKNPEFFEFLGLLDIRYSREVPTAGVTRGGRSALLINPEFAAEHCQTDMALLMLVLHELNHIMMGHTRPEMKMSKLHNIVFDAVINGQLCQTLPFWDATGLLTNLYRPDRFPEALLRPPEWWGTNREEWDLTGAALHAHQALYQEMSVTYEELFDLFKDAAKEEPVNSWDAAYGAASIENFDCDRLLGGHGETENDGEEGQQFRAIVGHVLDIWNDREKRHYGQHAGTGGRLMAGTLTPAEANRRAVAVIRQALISVMTRGQGVANLVRVVRGEISGMLPYRSRLDRRGEIRTLFGEEPLLFQSMSSGLTREMCGAARIYVDVSGSMSGVLPLIYGAVLPLMELIHPRIHLFSTTVSDVDPAQLRSGVVLTDGGTDISCVTGHMLAHGVRSALVVTDGYVGKGDEDEWQLLKKRGARLAGVVTNGGFRGTLEERCVGVTSLPELG